MSTIVKLCTVFGIALGVTATATIIDANRPASAQWSPFPYCAQFGGTFGGYNSCGFYTLQQCLATTSGVGGRCYPNPAYAGPPDEPRVRKHRRRHAS